MCEGVRAQIQHLKAYATAKPLTGACVDSRYKYVEKGCAPYVEWLGQKENPEGERLDGRCGTLRRSIHNSR